MKNKKRIWIILTFVVLIICIIEFSYFNTLKNINKDNENNKANTNSINYKFTRPPVDVEEEEEVSMFPLENVVTPSTVLIQKIVSINTGKVIEYKKIMPDEVVNFNKEKFQEYFKDYSIVEFNKDKVIIQRQTPYIPDYFLVKLEDKYIKIFITDSEGKATIYNEFTPKLCKNKDINLIKGIEVETFEEAITVIGDYD